MKIKLFAHIIFLLLCISAITAQTSFERPYSDQDEISDIVTDYFNAWKGGDAEEVDKVLHQSFRIKYMYEGDVQIMNKSMYVSGFTPSITPNRSHMHLVFINVYEDTAMARMDIKSSKQYASHYLNLVKSDNQWVIIDQLTKHEWQ